MQVKLINQKDILVRSSYKEIKERTKGKYYRTYSLKHDIKQGRVNLDKFFWEYNNILNSVIHYIYDTIVWKEWEIEKENVYQYKQKRTHININKRERIQGIEKIKISKKTLDMTVLKNGNIVLTG